MEFGGFSFARGRSLLAFSLVLLSGLEFEAWAQQAPASSPVENTVPALPPAEPVSEAAVGSGRGKADSAKSAPSGTPATSVATANEQSTALRLGAGDLLEISVYNVPELNTKARVGKSGDVYLPLIDYVHVGDLTVEEAQAMIQKRLEDGGFVRSAHVTIFLDESTYQGVTILGDVARPGIYPALGDRKLYDLISAAGGFTQTAGRKVSIIRQHGQVRPITVNLPRNLADDIARQHRDYAGRHDHGATSADHLRGGRCGPSRWFSGRQRKLERAAGACACGRERIARQRWAEPALFARARLE